MRLAYPICLLVLHLLVSPATAAPPDHSAVCKQHLQTIHQAIQAYERDHHQLPSQLADLVPKYLSDPSVLRCPDDDSLLGYRSACLDPRVPVSYSYEMSGLLAGGVGIPLGPTPHNPPNGWGTSRQFANWLQSFYGDTVPMVRCFHHRRPSDPDAPDVLNLTQAGRIYRSGIRWENSAEGALGLVSCLQRDLSAGAAVFNRNWGLWPLDYTVSDWYAVVFPAAARPRLRAVARLLEKQASSLHAPSYGYRIAARLKADVGDQTDAIRLGRKALALERGWMERVDTILMLAHLYERVGQASKAVPLIQQGLLSVNPKSTFYMNRLADAYEAMGRKQDAAYWRQRANPPPPPQPGWTLTRDDRAQSAPVTLGTLRQSPQSNTSSHAHPLQLVRVLHLRGGWPAGRLALSDDGRYLAVRCFDGQGTTLAGPYGEMAQVQIRRVEDGKDVQSLPKALSFGVHFTPVALSADGHWLAYPIAGDRIALYHVGQFEGFAKPQLTRD